MHKALLTLLLFFAGCSHEIYSGFCTQEPKKIDCLKAEDNNSKELLTTTLQKYSKKECPYVLQISHYEVGACSNPTVKSTGSDFDGYVRFYVYHNGVCYWRAQQDYKTRPWQELIEDLTKTMQKELLL